MTINKLIQRPASDGSELARDTFVDRAGDRQLALTLEAFDRGLGLAVEQAGAA